MFDELSTMVSRDNAVPIMTSGSLLLASASRKFDKQSVGEIQPALEGAAIPVWIVTSHAFSGRNKVVVPERIN
jgi:hypothetical protein